VHPPVRDPVLALSRPGARHAQHDAGLRPLTRSVTIRYQHWTLLTPTSDPSCYWQTTAQAADVLGVNTARVKQLAADDRLPHVTLPGGQRLYRRHQLEVIGDALLPRRLTRSATYGLQPSVLPTVGVRGAASVLRAASRAAG